MQREGRCTGTLTKQVRASLLSSEGSHLAMQPANTQRTECRFPQQALGRSDLVRGVVPQCGLEEDAKAQNSTSIVRSQSSMANIKTETLTGFAL